MNEELLKLFESIQALQKTITHISPMIYDTQASQLQTQIIHYLGLNPEQSVPQIALHRHSSRQNIQVIINELLTLAIVTKKVNPRHKRSFIYTLTSIGSDIFKHNKKAHELFLDPIGELFTTSELKKAEDVIDKLNEVLKK